MKITIIGSFLAIVEQKKYRIKYCVFEVLFFSWSTMYDET